MILIVGVAGILEAGSLVVGVVAVKVVVVAVAVEVVVVAIAVLVIGGLEAVAASQSISQPASRMPVQRRGGSFSNRLEAAHGFSRWRAGTRVGSRSLI